MNLFGGEKSAITLTFLAFFCIGNSFGIPYTKKLREDVRYVQEGYGCWRSRALARECALHILFRILEYEGGWL